MNHASIAAEAAAFKAARDAAPGEQYGVGKRYPSMVVSPPPDETVWRIKAGEMPFTSRQIVEVIPSAYLSAEDAANVAKLLVAARSTRLPEHIEELIAENARLRKALEDIGDCYGDLDEAKNIARTALEGK